MKKGILQSLLMLLMAIPGFTVTYTSYTSWYDDNPTGTKCFVSIYPLQDNTTITLYRESTENTTISTLVNTWPASAAGVPIHPIPMDPTGATGYGNSFFRLVADNPTAAAGTSLVNWEVASADEGSWPDWHTFIISTNGTFLGSTFYTYMFYDTGNAGNNQQGNSLAVINSGAGAVNVTVERWNGAAWVAAPATGSGGNTAAIPAGQVWMYGGVTSASAGDYRVTATGDVILWKGNAFETDHDNFFAVGASDNGGKIGKTVYGAAATSANYGSNPGAIVVTGIGGAATYDLYYYSYNTGIASLPSTTGGTWTRFIAGDTVNNGSSKSYSFNMAGTPAGPGSNGVFIKAVVTAGAQIQMESGQNILTGVSGDGDFLIAADTGRALGTEFYPTNGNNSNTLGVGGNLASKIIVIAPSTGTTVQVDSPGLATQSWTSTGDHMAHSFTTDYVEDATNPLNRVYTVTSSRPVYCFYETAGASGYGMEKGYSAVSPIPGPDLRINMSVNKTIGNPGETVTYTITYKNVGTDAATAAGIRLELPDGITWVSETVPGGGSPSGAAAGPGIRSYGFANIPADGVEHTITVAARLNDTDAGTHVYYNRAEINCAEKPAYVRSDPPALVFAVNQPQANYWKSYGVWDDNPPSGTNNQGYLHIYGLRENTNVRLYYSSNVDTSTCTNFMTINTTQAGFPTTVNAGGVLDVGPFATRFFKIEADYPLLWEFDSLGVADRAGYSMSPYSTDYKLADNKAFFTYMDYYHKTGCGTPDCPNTPRVGDVLGIINTSLTTQAEVVIYYSPDNGANWNYMGNLTIAPESVYLYGGTTQATAGDYLVVSVGDYTTNGGQNIIVYKGNNIGLDPLGNFGNYTNNQGMMYGISEKGQKADTSRLYGAVSNSTGQIVVTAIAGTPSYTVYRYNPAGGASTSWPVTGNTGTWVSVGTGGPLTTGGAPGIYTSAAKGFYKVEITGGTAQAAMGGYIFQEWAQGDGDYVGSADNRAGTGVTYPTINTGKDFYLSTGSGNGYFDVIMPDAGTTVQITGGGVAAAGGACNSANPAASSAADQALRFYTSGGSETHRIVSDNDILVQFQARDSDKMTKAFAGSPLYIAVIPTPTYTATPTHTGTATFTASPTSTPTFTASPTPSATASPTGTPTDTATETPTSTQSFTQTHTETVPPTMTFTDTHTATATGTETFTFTHTATSTDTVTLTHTFTQTVTGTPPPTGTFTETYTVTNTGTYTFTATVTNSPTGTNTNTDTVTLTHTFTQTVTGTPPPTNTFTETYTVTDTSTYTYTPTVTNSPTSTNTRTDTVTLTHTFTETVTGTPPPTGTFTGTPTETETYTVTNTRTETQSPTFTRTFTGTYSSTPTLTYTHTFTLTGTATSTRTFTATGTNTQTHTQTLTYTPTATFTNTPPGAPVDLQLKLTAGGDNPAPGARVTYRLSIENRSGSPVSNLSVWDSLPSNVRFIGSSFPVAPSQASDHFVAWDLSGMPEGTISGGGTLVIEFEVEITEIRNGDLISNTAWAEYNDPYYYPAVGKHPPVGSNVSYYPQDVIVVYPNPVNFASAKDGTLKFLNVIPGSLIQVYTVSGETVMSQTARAILHTWNGRNRYGAGVSPGIYYYVIENPRTGQMAKGRLFVVGN